MDERLRVARLHRRFGFGLTGGELAAAVGRGAEVEVDRLLNPQKHALAAPADPFVGLDLAFAVGGNRKAAVQAANAWVGRMVTSDRPAHERMAWFWHGLLVSSVSKVKSAEAMADQIRLFWTHGLGRLPVLLRAVAVDPAMLAYLDGKDSTKGAPNENFSRELLELFTLGVGNYTEADVQAGAKALTGWTARIRQNTASAVPRLHDDSPQTYLGVGGVHDVDSVIAAVTSHAACGPYIARRLARSVLGPAVASTQVDDDAAAFVGSGLDLSALLRTLADAHLAGVDGGPIVLGPVAWLVMAERATGARLLPDQRISGLRAAGQVPLVPPNVAGWPGGSAWYTSATLVGRLNLALVIAKGTPPDSAALLAAKRGDYPSLSLALGLPSDFSSSTVTGLSAVTDGFSRLALALVSPEFVEA
jgi:uncharacterized protein (DUF1800 family)